jgi:hypothetical protein
MKIIEAFYDKLDITDKLNKMINNDTLNVYASNDIFGDPNVGIVKKLICKYEYNNKIYDKLIYEGYQLKIPDSEPEINKILLISSCNRIKQVILALTINSYIIKDKFDLIIADCSTPEIDIKKGCEIHNKESYNHINEKNYCSDISLFSKYILKIKNIKNFYLINISPRMIKVEGDANLITLGLTQAALIGNDKIESNNNYCLKLTGVSILKFDLLSELPYLLNDHDVLTFHRSGFNHGERSTRIFGCRPEVLSKIMIEYGWRRWINSKSGDIEHRFADMLNEKIINRINYTNKDESCLLDGGGCCDKDYRNRLIKLIEENNIPKNDEIISEFLNGNIW